MHFRKRESDLERELRAQRPQPRDEFVHSLSRLVEPTRSMRRRAGVPKFALVGAMTVLLAASLGVTGALGSASHSLHSFSWSIGHLIGPKTHPGHPISALNGPTTSSSSSTTSSSSSSSPSSSSSSSTSSSDPTTSTSSSSNSATPDAGTPPGNPGYQPGYNPNPGPTDSFGRTLGASGFPLPNPILYPSFGHQYGFKIPICFHGHILLVSSFVIIWYLFHGAQPAWR